MGLTRDGKIGRRLSEEDMTFDKLMDDIRKDLALRYLDTGKVRLEDLTILLGFSSHAVFSALFMKWAGRTPRKTRTLS